MKVRAGFYCVPGYCETNAVSGGWKGVNIELVDSLAATNGWELTRVFGEPSKLMKSLAAGEIDLVPGLSHTSERAAKVDYVRIPHEYMRSCLFTRPDALYRAEAPSGWDGMRVGTIGKNLAVRSMRDIFSARRLKFHLRDYEDMTSLMEAFNAGECRGIVLPAVPALRGMRVLYRAAADPLYVCTAKARTDLRRAVERFLEAERCDPGIVLRRHAERFCAEETDDEFLAEMSERFFRRTGSRMEYPETLTAAHPARSGRSRVYEAVQKDDLAELRRKAAEEPFLSRPLFALIVSGIVVLALAAFGVYTALSDRQIREALHRSKRALAEADAAYGESSRIVKMGEALREGLEVLIRVRDVEEALPEVCRLWAGMLGLDRVCVTPVGGAAAEDAGVPAAVLRALAEFAEAGGSAAASAATLDRVEDAEAQKALRKFFGGSGTKSAFAVPLVVDGKTWGSALGWAAADIEQDAAARRYTGMFAHAVEAALATAAVNAELAVEHGRLEANVRRLREVVDQQRRLRGMLETLAGEEEQEADLAGALAEAADLFGSPCCVIVHRREDGRALDRPFMWLSDSVKKSGILRKEIQPHEMLVSALLEQENELIYARGAIIGEYPDLDALMDRYGAKSLLATALRVNDVYWGHILFLADARAATSDDTQPLLMEIARVAEIFIRRRQMSEEIALKQKGLEAALAEAEEAARAKTRFLATMSHEIRTPLNAVVGFSEYLVKPDTPAPLVKEYAEAVERGSKVLLKLVNDILDLSRLEFGSQNLRRGRCDFGKLFAEIAAMYGPRAETKSVGLRVAIAKNFPPMRIAEQPMRQILLNLAGNAVKFTSRGYVQLAVAWTRNAAGRADVRIIVRDTGCGMSEERLAEVLDPFAQDIAAHGDVYRGTGLGLPLVKRLAEAAGGRVAISSHVGRGTAVAVDMDDLEILSPEAAAAPGAETELVHPERIRVFAADDVAMNLKILGVHFARLGVKTVETATDGLEALEKMRVHPPDVAFLDMWMPGMDGAALARAVRADPLLADVRLVAVTADADVERTFDTGAFDRVLTKPATSEKIRRALADLAPGSGRAATGGGRS